MAIERRFFSISSSRGEKVNIPDHFPETTTQELDLKWFSLPDSTKESLTPRQEKILDILSEIPEIMSEIYRMQKGNGKPGIYPRDITEGEFATASEGNANFLSPTTMVHRDHDGQLISIPYHEIFEDYLVSVISSLKKAANLAGKGKERDNFLQGYLRAKATSFMTGEYSHADELMVEAAKSKIGVVVGWYDTNFDTFTGRKLGAEGWIDVLDEESTADSQEFVDRLVEQEDSFEVKPKIYVRISDTRVIFGQAYDYKWTANSLPWDRKVRKEVGSVFTVFKPRFETFSQARLGAFRQLIHPKRRMGITDELAKKAMGRRYLAHETYHSFIPEDMEDRFGKHTAWLKELFCDVVSLDNYANMRNLEPRESTVALATALTEGRLELTQYQERSIREEYLISSSIILNYLLASKSINIENGRFNWKNTGKVFESLHRLAEDVKTLVLREKTDSDLFNKIANNYDPTVYDNLELPEKPVKWKFLTPTN